MTDIPPKETPEKRRARIATVLERGFINHKLNLDFLKPENLVGQYVRNEPNEIARLEALDFHVYKGENVPKVHGSSDGTIRVGDTILMVTSPEVMEDIRFVEAQMVRDRHDPKKQAEEKIFTHNLDEGITPIVTSRVEEANADHITSALKEER